MNLLYPIGLLGLIGIPILILIYIIKSKYREYTISSTYIWKLSERFLKKKSPLSKLSGLLSLILQILTVLFLSFALAHPILTLPNSARNYVLVVDNSASMNISTRMQDVKDEIMSFSIYSILKRGFETYDPEATAKKTFNYFSCAAITNMLRKL